MVATDGIALGGAAGTAIVGPAVGNWNSSWLQATCMASVWQGGLYSLQSIGVLDESLLLLLEALFLARQPGSLICDSLDFII